MFKVRRGGNDFAESKPARNRLRPGDSTERRPAVYYGLGTVLLVVLIVLLILFLL